MARRDAMAEIAISTLNFGINGIVEKGGISRSDGFRISHLLIWLRCCYRYSKLRKQKISSFILFSLLFNFSMLFSESNKLLVG